MSQLLQVAVKRGNGVLSYIDGTGVPPVFNGGIPFNASGQLAVHNLGTIDHYHQGLPFTSNGRLCIALNGTVARVDNGGVPFNAAGFVVLSTTTPDHYSAGIPYTVSNGVGATVLSPP